MLRPLFKNITPIVEKIVIINVFIFILSYILINNYEIDLNREFGLYYFGLPFFQIYQIITCVFLHGSLPHLFFNMFTLISLGSALEYYWGSKRFLFFYLACGIGGSILSLIAQAFQTYFAIGGLYPTVADLPMLSHGILSLSVGASGALFGVFAALSIIRPDAEFNILFIPFPIKANILFPALIAIEAILGICNFKWDFFGHFAHLGGALTGALIIQLYKKFSNS